MLAVTSQVHRHQQHCSPSGTQAVLPGATSKSTLMGKCFSVCSTTSSSVDNGKNNKQFSPKYPQSEISSAPAGHQTHPLQRNDSSGTPGTVILHGTGRDVSNGSRGRQLDNPRQFSYQKGVETSAAMKSDFSEKKANKLFERYRDVSEDTILAEGTERFCQDLQVNHDDFIVLVLAWKFQAAVMCRFTRTEFTHGCRAIRADSIEAIKSKFPELQQEVRTDDSLFKDLYRYTFGFGLDTEGRQRTLPCEIAIPLWKLVFHSRQPPILNRWCNFLTENQVKGISRDTWQMFLHFVEVIGDNLSNYDDNEAWPSLFDDFVEYENERLKDRKEQVNAENSQGETQVVHD